MIKIPLQYPKDKEILTSISLEVQDLHDEHVQTVIQDLKDTLNNSDGAGISAIQIGEPLRICVINYGGKSYTLINPVITWTRNGPHSTKKFLEGCLSVPGKYIEVERPQKVICEYIDENGNNQQLAEGGWLSAIIQHELDHMDGTCALFKDETKNE